MSRFPRIPRWVVRAACATGWTALLLLASVPVTAAAGSAELLRQTGLGRIAVWTAPRVDVERLLAEDAANVGKRVPYRIGTALDVGLTPADSGTWQREGGLDVWRLVLHSPGAHWLLPVFDRVHLEPGAELWLYDPDRHTRRGPFTAAHVVDGRISFMPIEGDTLVVEIDWPAGTPVSKLDFQLGRIFHGYRSWNGAAAGLCTDDAGACNIDINCPLGDDWQDEKRGVVKLLIPDLGSGGNVALCSGALINNTELDCTPYVLTADHCFTPDSNLVDTMFIFGYERPGCGPGSTTEAVFGTHALLRASNSATGFQLLEVVQSFPTEDLYFNGWSRSTLPPLEAQSIHHPKGAPMKISHTGIPLVLGDGNPYPDGFWRVIFWDQGVVEFGSSGSPLFDPAGRIIGQLDSGSSECVGSQPNSLGDNFGRLDVSWEIHATRPDRRLKDWLDPTGSDVSSINGMDQSFCGDRRGKPVHTGHLVDENQGNRDGILDPGDIAQLEVQLTNAGPLAAGSVDSGMTGTLSLVDPEETQVTIVVDGADWPQIQSGQAAASAAPHFTIDVDGDRLCGRSIEFQIEAESDVSTFRIGTGTPAGHAQHFGDDIETDTDLWSVSPEASWTRTTSNSAPGGGNWSWFVPDGFGVSESHLIMPSYGSRSVQREFAEFVGLPPSLELRFEHYLSSECGSDGGVLEYSTDGSTWKDAGPLITEGGYNSVILPDTGGILAGRLGWSGDLGAWTMVRVDFSSLEGADDLHLRWLFATDELFGGDGWYLDNVVLESPLFECAPSHLRLVPGAFCRGHLEGFPWPTTLCGAGPGRSSFRR